MGFKIECWSVRRALARRLIRFADKLHLPGSHMYGRVLKCQRSHTGPNTPRSAARSIHFAPRQIRCLFGTLLSHCMYILPPPTFYEDGL